MTHEHLGSAPKEEPESAENPDEEDRREEGENEGIAVSRTEEVKERWNTAENNPNSHHNPRDVAPDHESSDDGSVALSKFRGDTDVFPSAKPKDACIQKCDRNTSYPEPLGYDREEIHIIVLPTGSLSTDLCVFQQLYVRQKCWNIPGWRRMAVALCA